MIGDKQPFDICILHARLARSIKEKHDFIDYLKENGIDCFNLSTGFKGHIKIKRFVICASYRVIDRYTLGRIFKNHKGPHIPIVVSRRSYEDIIDKNEIEMDGIYIDSYYGYIPSFCLESNWPRQNKWTWLPCTKVSINIILDMIKNDEGWPINDVGWELIPCKTGHIGILEKNNIYGVKV